MRAVRDLQLHEPPSNSLEANITALNHETDFLYLDLHQANKPQWVCGPISARLGQGSVKEGDKVEYSFSEYDISAGYDGILYLENTHATQPIKQHNENKLVGTTPKELPHIQASRIAENRS